jgi:hypothetical protein
MKIEITRERLSHRLVRKRKKMNPNPKSARTARTITTLSGMTRFNADELLIRIAHNAVIKALRQNWTQVVLLSFINSLKLA